MNRNAKIGIVSSALILVLGLGLLLGNRSPGNRPGLADFTRVFQALDSFARDYKKQGKPIPASVDLETLVRMGYLQPDDARAFGESKVMFHTDANETNPQSILIEVTSSNGLVTALLGDGSVQQFTREHLRLHRSALGE